MKVSIVNKRTRVQEKAVTDQVIFDTENGGPKYRVTVNIDGTLCIREITHRTLILSPSTANTITIGATGL